MENIFIDFLPPWVETGLQPAFYDKESGTVLQQTARMYHKVFELTKAFNDFSLETTNAFNTFTHNINETVDDYINQFNELHDYVHDYFDNLDVQEEINNKLDQMQEEGTLQEIITQYIQSNVEWTFDTVADMQSATNLINGSYARTIGYNAKDDGYGEEYFISDVQADNSILLDSGLYATPVKGSILKFHVISASSATYIVEFPNGKNMIVDTGTSGEWDSIKAVLDANNWKFDYGIITHFHVDHVGNLNSILASYTNPNSTWWVQMKPDYINHSSDIVDNEQRYDDTIQIFTDNGITPIVPTNDSYVDITQDIKLHFLNTSTAWAENYYGQVAEWHEDQTGINFNFFSLVTELIHKNNRILFTGDIERIVEQTIYPYLHKCSIMTAPHHLVNRDASLPFYQTTKPEFAIGMHQSAGFTWIKNWFKSYIYLDDLNAKIITPQGTVATNGLYTFISNGYVSSSMALSNGNWVDYDKQGLFGYFEQLTNYATQKIATISLKECLLNLKEGWIFKNVYYGSIATDFPQVANDIKAIFPFIDSGYQIEMCRPPKNPAQAYIKITSSRAEYIAFTYNLTSDTTTWRSQGNATHQTQINSFADLVTFLSTRPIGHYRIIYKDDEGTVLDTSTTYQLSIDIQQSLVDDSRLTCNIYAVARIADNTSATAYVVSGFINATSTTNPPHKWRKLV